jgi:hypothetical protein
MVCSFATPARLRGGASEFVSTEWVKRRLLQVRRDLVLVDLEQPYSHHRRRHPASDPRRCRSGCLTACIASLKCPAAIQSLAGEHAPRHKRGMEYRTGSRRSAALAMEVEF